MPCTYTVKLSATVSDEAVAKAALKELGWNKRINKVGDKFEITGLSNSEKEKFMTTYGRTFAKMSAQENMFELASEEETSNEVVMVFRKSF